MTPCWGLDEVCKGVDLSVPGAHRLARMHRKRGRLDLCRMVSRGKATVDPGAGGCLGCACRQGVRSPRWWVCFSSLLSFRRGPVRWGLAYSKTVWFGGLMAIAARLLGCVALVIHGFDGVLFLQRWLCRSGVSGWLVASVPGRDSFLLVAHRHALSGRVGLGPAGGCLAEVINVFLGSVFWLCSSGAWSLSRLVEAPRSVRAIVGQAAYFPAQASLVWGGCLL